MIADQLTEDDIWLMTQTSQRYQTTNFTYMLDKKENNVFREGHMVLVIECCQDARLLKSKACLLYHGRQYYLTSSTIWCS